MSRNLHAGTPHDSSAVIPSSTSHAKNDTHVVLSSIPQEGAHFCSSGTSFGDDRDLAQCSIVQLLLGGNNLSGTIASDLVTVLGEPSLRQLALNNLQSIQMESNGLTGAFPLWITELPNLAVVRVVHNAFS